MPGLEDGACMLGTGPMPRAEVWLGGDACCGGMPACWYEEPSNTGASANGAVDETVGYAAGLLTTGVYGGGGAPCAIMGGSGWPDGVAWGYHDADACRPRGLGGMAPAAAVGVGKLP